MEQLSNYSESADFDETAELAWDGLCVAMIHGGLKYPEAAKYMESWFPNFIIPDAESLGLHSGKSSST